MMKKRNAKTMAMMGVMAAGMVMASAAPVSALEVRSTTQFDKYLVMDAAV